MQQGFDRIVNIDGDGSHDPGEIPNLLTAGNDRDLVSGSRYVKVKGGRVVDWPQKRWMLSKVAADYFQAITGMPFRDPRRGSVVFIDA